VTAVHQTCFLPVRCRTWLLHPCQCADVPSRAEGGKGGGGQSSMPVRTCPGQPSRAAPLPALALAPSLFSISGRRLLGLTSARDGPAPIPCRTLRDVPWPAAATSPARPGPALSCRFSSRSLAAGNGSVDMQVSKCMYYLIDYPHMYVGTDARVWSTVRIEFCRGGGP